MKIAVTTASGQLGSAIVKQLIADTGKENVVGIARTPQKAAHLGVEVRQGDYNSREQFDAALKGIDTVLIISGMDTPDKRIGQHRNIIEAAKTNKVKKIVYTSIAGDKAETAFTPIVRSNRQTEQDIQDSGLAWVIGRNGLYIDSDLEHIDHYINTGEIANAANNGLCAYTHRNELAIAYSHLLRENKHHGKIYNLVGEPVTQSQLAGYINQTYDSAITFKAMTADEYTQERKAALGEFMGTIIGGIYSGIQQGGFNPESHFEQAAGRPHKTTLEIIQEFKATQKTASQV